MISTNNYLPHEEFKSKLEEVCTKIYDVLSHHCGPRAKNALIIQHDEGAMRKFTNVFTKDGINIVNSLEFESVMETHIKDSIAYLGERVDNKAHDGTTTSMMLLADLLRTLPPKMMHLTAVDSDHILHACIDRLERIILDNTITTADLVETFAISLDQAKNFVSYCEAMISSKGDRELSNAITEVVQNLPPELFGQFNLSQNPLETENRFTVLYDDFDFPIQVTFPVDHYNAALGTEYLCEDCDLLVTENQLIRGNPDAIRILDYIAKLGTDEEILERPLILLSANLDDRLYTAISVYNETHTIKLIPVALIGLNKQMGKSQMLQAMMLSAGMYRMEEYPNLMDAVIRHARVQVKKNNLLIGHLYEKDGSMYHPFFVNPETFPPYTKKVQELQAFLRSYLNDHLRDTLVNEHLVSEWIDVLRRLICQKTCRLQVSGSTHDSLADHSVVKDSFGAVLSALEKGFVLDGFWTILSVLDVELSIGHTSDQYKKTGVIVSYFDAMTEIYHVIKRLVENIHGFDQTPIFAFQGDAKFSYFPYPENAEYYISKHSANGYDPLETEICVRGVHTGISIRRFGQTSILAGHYHTAIPLIQPLDGFKELFKRIRELLPKFSATVCCITPGTLHEQLTEQREVKGV